jgi:recombination protein RecA
VIFFPATRPEIAAKPAQPKPWNLAEIAGRLVEISGSGPTATLTLAFGLVLEGQRQGELVGWVGSTENSFYPPDTAHEGVDLDTLVVVRVPDDRAIPRAGEKLLRSGAFGLVVLDVGAANIPMPLQSRLSALSLQHHTALLCLTAKESADPSLGSLVSLRVDPKRKRISDSRFACELRVLKDKRRGPSWSHMEVCFGPAGLR